MVPVMDSGSVVVPEKSSALTLAACVLRMMARNSPAVVLMTTSVTLIGQAVGKPEDIDAILEVSDDVRFGDCCAAITGP